MTQSGFYAGVVRKKYTLFCVAPDGAKVELNSCYDANAAQVAREASQKILSLMAESFEMEEGFQVQVVETMESADDMPLSKMEKNVSTNA